MDNTNLKYFGCGVIFILIIIGIIFIGLPIGTKGMLVFGIDESRLSKDENLNIVTDICSTFPFEQEQIQCIIDFYARHYNYVEHGYFSLHDTTDYLSKGNVCRDFSVNICTALEQINISCRYEFMNTNHEILGDILPNHVMPVLQYNGEEYLIKDNGVMVNVQETA